MKYFVTSFLVFLTLVFSPVSAKANTEANATPCTDDLCVVFEVALKFNTFQEKPVVKAVIGTVDIGGTTSTYHVVVSRSEYECRKQVKVLREQYLTMKQITASMSGTNGEAPPVLTPTQQYIMAFYVTLMQQTQGFACSPKDFQNPIDTTTQNGQVTPIGGVTNTPYNVRIVGVVGTSNTDAVVLVEVNGEPLQLGIGDSLYPGCVIVEINSEEPSIRVNEGGVLRTLRMGF